MKTDLISMAQDEVISEQKYSNGLILLLSGAAMIVMCLTNLLSYWFSIGFMPLLFFYIYAKKHIVHPRIGYVQLNLKKTTKPVLLKLLGVMFLFIGLGLFFLLGSLNMTHSRQINWSVVMFLLAYLILVYVIIMNWERGSWLLYSDNLVLVLAVLAVNEFKLPDYVSWTLFMAWGIANLIIGSVLLKRFIKNYPVVQDEN